MAVTQHAGETLQRVQAAVARIEAFLQAELEAATAGNVNRLEELGRDRGAVEADVAELSAQLAALRGERVEGDPPAWAAAVEAGVQNLFVLARQSQEQVESLKNCVVEGLEVLGVVRRAAKTYEAPRPLRGALVDREG